MRQAVRTILACALLAAGGCAPSRGGAGHSIFPVGATDAARTSPGSLSSAPIPIRREPWRTAEFEGLLITTPHYRLYTTVTEPEFLDRLGRFYELALAQYRSALTDLPEPDQRLEAFVFRDREQWHTKTRQMLPEQARSFLGLGRGGLTTRGTSVLYDIGPRGTFRDTFAIAAHEGWHQYTQRSFREHLPIWLEEGIATYMEGYRECDRTLRFRPWDNPERLRTLQEAAREDRLFSMQELLTRTPQSFLEKSKDHLLIYYAQVWAMTHFLVEGTGGRYRSSLERILHDAAGGKLTRRLRNYIAVSAQSAEVSAGRPRLGPAAVLAYFHDDPAAFERQYLDFIDRLVNMGGRPGTGSPPSRPAG